MGVPYTDEFLTLNGLRFHYQDWGNPSAPPLLMVHGLTRNGHAFDQVAERLREKFRCLAVDVRGRGQSDWGEPADYHNPQYVQDISALLRELGLERVHWLGTSMGGLIAMTLAAERPQLFESLVLNDIGPDLAKSGGKRIERFIAGLPQSFSSWEACIDFEAERYPWIRDFSKAELEEAYRWYVRQREDGSWVFHFDPRVLGGRASSVERFRQARENHWKGLKALRCPTLLVRGAESDLLARETVEEMRRVQPKMEFVEVPGVGHAPSLGEPEAAAALDEFYGRLAG